MQYFPARWVILICSMVFSYTVSAQNTESPTKDTSDWVKSTISSFADNYIKTATRQVDIQRIKELRTILDDTINFKKLKKSLLSSLNIPDTGLSRLATQSLNSEVLSLSSQSKSLLKESLLSTLNATGLQSILGRIKPALSSKLLEFRNATLSVSGQTRPSIFDNSRSTYLNNTSLTASITALGIPIEATVTRQDYFEEGYRSQIVFNWNFNRDEYLNKLKQVTQLNLRPEELASMGMGAVNKAKQQAQAMFQQKLNSLGENFEGDLGDKIAKYGQIDQFLHVDINSISQELLSPEVLAAQFDREKLLQVIQSKVNLGEQIDTSLLKSVQEKKREYEKLLELLQMIKSQKEEWEKNGWLDKLKKLETDQLQQVSEWMNNPDKLKSLIKDKMNLSGLQKMFLNVNGMSVGRNTVTLSPLSVYGFLNNGVNIEFLNNNNYLFLMAGKQKDFANLSDFRMISSSFSNDNMALGLRIGKGSLEKSHSHLSIFKYQQTKTSYGSTALRFFPSSSVVATLSNQLQLGANHSLRAELSKSSRSYTNESTIVDTLSAGSRRGGKLLSSENLAQQLAATLEYEGEIERWNLSQQLFITYTGNDYSNPGAVFMGRAMKEIGGRVKKTFLKRKLQVAVRGTYREYSYSGTDSKWKNSNFSFSSRLRLKFGQYLSFSYQPYQSMRLQESDRMKTGGSDRLTFEAGLRKKWRKIVYSNTLNISLVKNDYQFDSLMANNRSVQLSSMNSLTVNGKSFFLSITHNRVNSPSNIAFFNTTTNSDLGISYRIGKMLQSSSSIGFSEVKGWYRQIGIRQSIGGQISKRIFTTIYLDLNKNLIEYRPNNMDRIRGDWSVQYRLFK